LQPFTTAPAHIFPEGATVLQFVRNPSEDINTTASYRYFQNLTEDIARNKREQLERAEREDGESSSAATTSTSQHGDAKTSRAGPRTVNGNNKHGKNGVEAKRKRLAWKTRARGSNGR
jgi:hypothetical protein